MALSLAEFLTANAQDKLNEYEGGLSERVQKEINYMVTSYKASLVYAAKFCESPIEHLLWIRVYEVISENLEYYVDLDSSYHIINFSPQVEVKTRDRKYRVDIYVKCFAFGEIHEFAIECDGHDFHEKSKEQVAKDKARERDLQSIGITVVRFSGSEIYKNPLKCALDFEKIYAKTTGLQAAFEKKAKEFMES